MCDLNDINGEDIILDGDVDVLSGHTGDLSRQDELSVLLDQLDRRPPDPDLNEGAQYRAAEILAELVTRYKLDVSQVRRFKAAKEQRATK